MSKKEAKDKKRRNQEKKLYLFAIISTLLCIIVIFLSYFVINTNGLKPEINEETANYISFNNSNTTDMLKISNLQKNSDEKGMSNVNEKKLDFKITGKKGSKYKIILYPINNKSELKKIKFYLTKDKRKVAYDSLDNAKDSEDGGIIIFEGTVSESNFTLQMWLSKDYHKNTNNISFEVKVK